MSRFPAALSILLLSLSGCIASDSEAPEQPPDVAPDQEVMHAFDASFTLRFTGARSPAGPVPAPEVTDNCIRIDQWQSAALQNMTIVASEGQRNLGAIELVIAQPATNWSKTVYGDLPLTIELNRTTLPDGGGPMAVFAFASGDASASVDENVGVTISGHVLTPDVMRFDSDGNVCT